MEWAAPNGPVVVCLWTARDVAIMVQCAVALARLSDAPLYIVSLLKLPPQRPLGLVLKDEEQRANLLLDIAAKHVSNSGVTVTEEICVARSWPAAIQQLAQDLQASAIVVGWHGAGPFQLLDAGRKLLKAVHCPMIMVASGTLDYHRCCEEGTFRLRT